MDLVATARAVAFLLHEGLKSSGQDPSKMSLEQQCEALLENEAVAHGVANPLPARGERE